MTDFITLPKDEYSTILNEIYQRITEQVKKHPEEAELIMAEGRLAAKYVGKDKLDSFNKDLLDDAAARVLALTALK